MALQLRNGLTYCLVDGHPIFLDIVNDRYLRLPSALEHAFVTHVEGGEGREEELRDLVKRDILTTERSNASYDYQPDLPSASGSVLECAFTERTLSTRLLLEVLSIVCLTLLQLKVRPMKSNLDALATYRARRSSTTTRDQDDATDLLAAARQFNYARRFVPVETVCFLDSLAMVRFLSKRRLYANIVIGVTCNPFDAHCWVQARDLLLNDTLGNSRLYTPIRVV